MDIVQLCKLNQKVFECYHATGCADRVKMYKMMLVTKKMR